MIWALLILISLYLPGHFLGRAVSRKDDGLAEAILLRVACSASVAAPVLVSLSLAGWFTAPVISVCLLICAVAAWFAGRGGAGTKPPISWGDAGALGLIAGSFVLYGRPAEYVVNTRDPGVYTLFARKLASTGALLHHDPLVRAVSGFHTFVEARKYPGFYILDEALIVPQFFPGPISLMGFGDLIGGVWGGLYVAPVLGALGVGMAFVFGRELFGRWAGLCGAALLAVGYTQVWWSRQPSSEIPSQFFVLSGLWLAVRFARGAGPLTGVMAGLSLGGVMLMRPDGFLAAIALPLIFGYYFLLKRSAWRWLYPGVPLAIFAGASLLYLNTVGGRYLYVIYSEHGLDRFLGLLPYLIFVLIIVIAGFIIARYRWGRWMGIWLETHGRWLALAGALCIAALALWAYFILPVPVDSLPDDSRGFNTYRTQVLVRMVWFTTPVVAALGLAGFLLAARRLDVGRAILLGAFLAFGVLYVAVPNVAPDLPWATRRFVPAVFPGLCLLAGYAVAEVGSHAGRMWNRRMGIAVSVILAMVALGWSVHAMLPIAGMREYRGAVESFEKINDKIPEASVVFVEGPDGFDLTASTFEYLYGRPVLPYDRDLFIDEVDELGEAGLLKNAVYVTTDGEPAPLLSEVDFRQVGAADLELPRLAPTEGDQAGLSARPDPMRMNYRIYRVEKEH
ncbi:MAG: glycosyltransferase family 39 protein [Rubrobacter sp.]|nr:glycosyltransferase family 39 protein [Rubrobacter sp.]